MVLDRDAWRCRVCGSYGNECDHIRPLHRGGAPLDPNNLQTLCRACHIEKTQSENGRASSAPDRADWRALVERIVKY